MEEWEDMEDIKTKEKIFKIGTWMLYLFAVFIGFKSLIYLLIEDYFMCLLTFIMFSTTIIIFNIYTSLQAQYKMYKELMKK